MSAYSDMLTHTSTPQAPWWVIPADNKWFMRWAVAEIICSRLKALDIDYPEMTEAKKSDLKAAMEEINSELSEK
jgi:hypothetical protein